MTESALPRIKVAYFVPPSQHFAGIERVTHEIASGLAQAHSQILDVHVVYSSPYDELSLLDTPYTLHVLGVERLRGLAFALRGLVAEEHFDVLITPQVEASVVAWVATRRLGLPVLLPHLHGNPQLEQAEGTLRTKAAFKAFTTVVARRVPAIMAVSPSLRDYAAATLARKTRVVYAPNPVRDLGRPVPEASADGRFRFVCVARLSRQKGQDLLLRALADARPLLPPVELTLVGQGPAESDLRALCTELGLDDIVTFAGYATDPVPYLRAADCFVLASRWEGFGVALVEALQCGLPLLATNCDFGPADIILDPVIGTLVANEGVDALAKGLVVAASRTRNLADDERRRAAAREYRRDAVTAAHFSILRSVATA